MGIFHCVQDGCAEVRYQPYQKTAGIRYRYPGEDWITVADSDDYELQEFYDCYTSFTILAQINTAYQWNGSNLVPIGTRYAHVHSYETGVIDYYELEFFDYPSPPETGVLRLRFFSDIYPDGSNWINLRQRNTDYWKREEFDNGNYSLSLNPRPPAIKDECNGCKLLIKKNDEIVFSRSSPECPEVEKLENNDECQLSDRYQVIKVEKQPYLQRIEVRDQDIQGYGIGGTLIDTSPLPEECLNIYKTFVTAPPFPNNTVPTAAIFNPYEFVAQICSDPGCPPPEYTVVCRCGEECPSGTCPVFCGDHVCCHDPNTGNSVYQIPLGEYSGGDL